MQILMAIMRYLVIFTLMFTSILEIAGVTENWENVFDEGNSPQAINFSALGIVIPLICFSLCY